MTINEELKNEFETKMKKFINSKSHGVLYDLSYVIDQVHNLYCMIAELKKEELLEMLTEDEKITEFPAKDEDNDIEEPIENVESEETTEEQEIIKEDPNKISTEIFDKILSGENVNLSDDPSLYGIEDKSVSDIMKEELNNWGLDEDYLGCKFILRLVECAENADIKPDNNYEEICKKVSDYCSCIADAAQFKRAITFIRKKADFSKSDYLSILKVLEPSKINNEVLLKNIIELCY